MRGDRCGSFEPSAAAAGRGLALDAVQFGRQIGHAADVGVAQDMGQTEQALRGRDLDHRGDIDVVMGHQLPAPVAVGVDVGVGRGGAGNAGHHEGGQRRGRVVGGEQPLRRGHIHLGQPVHRRHPPPGAHRRGDQPPVGRKWPYLGPAWTLTRHEQSLTPGRGVACMRRPGAGGGIWRQVSLAPCKSSAVVPERRMGSQRGGRRFLGQRPALVTWPEGAGSERHGATRGGQRHGTRPSDRRPAPGPAGGRPTRSPGWPSQP